MKAKTILQIIINMTAKDMFSKIDNDAHREKIFTKLTQESPELEIQMQNNDVLKVKSFKKGLNELIIFRSLPEQPEEQPVIVSFVIEPERYFMKTKLVQKDKNCHIALSPLLYKLQRRKNFRLQIPEFWRGLFFLKLYNTEKQDKDFPLNDLSSGGFSFVYAAKSFQVEEDAELEGRIKIPNRLDINIKATVKHYRDTGTPAYPTVKVGLEFKDLDVNTEQKIMSLLMEIHREIFSRLE